MNKNQSNVENINRIQKAINESFDSDDQSGRLNVFFNLDEVYLPDLLKLINDNVWPQALLRKVDNENDITILSLIFLLKEEDIKNYPDYIEISKRVWIKL